MLWVTCQTENPLFSKVMGRQSTILRTQTVFQHLERNYGKHRRHEKKMKLGLDHISCTLAHRRHGFHPGYPPPLLVPGFAMDPTTASLATSGSIWKRKHLETKSTMLLSIKVRFSLCLLIAQGNLTWLTLVPGTSEPGSDNSKLRYFTLVIWERCIPGDTVPTAAEVASLDPAYRAAGLCKWMILV